MNAATAPAPHSASQLSTQEPEQGLLATLDLLRITRAGPGLHLRLNRPAKRNALSAPFIQQLHTVFVNTPEDVRAVVISGEGSHFCAGLDLSEEVARDIESVVLHGAVVDGGGSACIPRLMGVARVAGLMLTGLVYDAQERRKAFLEGRAGKVLKS